MRINTNVASLNSQRILGQTNDAVGRSIGRLSSGFRINRAADDAAGLGIANKLRADIRSMKQASRNAEQANSLLQVAEGATQTVANILDRMKELATLAGSDNVDTAGRERIKAEWDQLSTEIERIVDTTKFQGSHLLKATAGQEEVQAADATSPGLTALATANAGITSGTTGAAATGGEYRLYRDGTDVHLERATGTGSWDNVGTAAASGTITGNGLSIALAADISTINEVGTAHTFSVTGAVQAQSAVEATGARNFLVSSSGEYTSHDLVQLGGLNLTTGAEGLDLPAIADADVGDAAAWRGALSGLDSAISHTNTVLGEIGAAQNRIEFATANVKTAIENFAAAESTIRDADMAAEMAEFTRNQILQQAGTAMLAQANSAPQMVLRLLQ